MALLPERLLADGAPFSLSTYNVLWELLVEKMTLNMSHYELEHTGEDRFENSVILKSIAEMLVRAPATSQQLVVRKRFLLDVIAMCRSNRENRR